MGDIVESENCFAAGSITRDSICGTVQKAVNLKRDELWGEERRATADRNLKVSRKFINDIEKLDRLEAAFFEFIRLGDELGLEFDCDGRSDVVDVPKEPISRLEYIEACLTQAEKIGPRESKLLIEWLETTPKEIRLEFEGEVYPSKVEMDVEADGRISGFRWGFCYDREVEEGNGKFSVKLFGWTFSHYGVTYAYPDDWYESEWWEDCPSREVGNALDRKLAGHVGCFVEHLEEIDMSGCVESAIDRYGEADGWGYVPELHFFTDVLGRVYVFKAYMKDGHGEPLPEEEQEPLPDIPDSLREISLGEAITGIQRMNLDFVYDVCL